MTFNSEEEKRMVLSAIREVYNRYRDFYSNNLFTFHREAALQVIRMYDVLSHNANVSREDGIVADHAFLNLHGGAATYYSCTDINEELIDALLYKFDLSPKLHIPDFPSGYICPDEATFIDKYCILLNERSFDDLREKYADLIEEYRSSGVECPKIKIIRYYVRIVKIQDVDRALNEAKSSQLICELDPDFSPKDEEEMEKEGKKWENQQARIYIELKPSNSKYNRFRSCIIHSDKNPTLLGGKLKLPKGSLLAKFAGYEENVDAVSESEYRVHYMLESVSELLNVK